MRIEVLDRTQSRSELRSLFDRVYPEAVLRNIVWRNVASAPPDRRVVLVDDANRIIASAGLTFRAGLRDGAPVQIGGVGGVMVTPERQRQGLGRKVMFVAYDELRACPALSFGLLFCEPHNVGFYESIGWQRFSGEVRVEQPAGSIIYDIMETMTLDLGTSAPHCGSIDLCGLPW